MIKQQTKPRSYAKYHGPPLCVRTPKKVLFVSKTEIGGLFLSSFVRRFQSTLWCVPFLLFRIPMKACPSESSSQRKTVLNREVGRRKKSSSTKCFLRLWNFQEGMMMKEFPLLKWESSASTQKAWCVAHRLVSLLDLFWHWILPFAEREFWILPTECAWVQALDAYLRWVLSVTNVQLSIAINVWLGLQGI